MPPDVTEYERRVDGGEPKERPRLSRAAICAMGSVMFCFLMGLALNQAARFAGAVMIYPLMLSAIWYIVARVAPGREPGWVKWNLALAGAAVMVLGLMISIGSPSIVEDWWRYGWRRLTAGDQWIVILCGAGLSWFLGVQVTNKMRRRLAG